VNRRVTFFAHSDLNQWRSDQGIMATNSWHQVLPRTKGQVMNSSLTSTLIQISIPAAIQLITLVIPALYIVVTQNEAHESSSKDHQRYDLFLWMMGVCIALYLVSLSILAIRTISADGSHSIVVDALVRLSKDATFITISDIVVLVIMIAFCVFPILVFYDVRKRDSRHYRGLLEGYNSSEQDRAIESIVVNSFPPPRSAQETVGRVIDTFFRESSPMSLTLQTMIDDFCSKNRNRLIRVGLDALHVQLQPIKGGRSRTPYAHLLTSAYAEQVESFNTRRYDTLKSDCKQMCEASGADSKLQNVLEVLAAVAVWEASALVEAERARPGR